MHFRFPAFNILGAALPYIEPFTCLCCTFAACGNVCSSPKEPCCTFVASITSEYEKISAKRDVMHVIFI